MGDITVTSQTQRIIVNHASRSVGVVNSGPIGPTGPQGGSGKITGDYNPTLTNIVLGTGGSMQNDAHWEYFAGRLYIEGLFIVGNTGQSYPTSNIVVSLPTGFELESQNPNIKLGECFYDFALKIHGGIIRNSNTSVLLYPINGDFTWIYRGSTNASQPGAWAAGTRVDWTLEARAVQV